MPNSVLVIDDSDSVRYHIISTLKNVSLFDQYREARDGIDGFKSVLSAKPDLIICDLEMPRMDGFDLTAKVRSDKQLAELPIVLVTALESREHRERGIDAGANAYIVKSSFDQSNLLEVIKRLI